MKQVTIQEAMQIALENHRAGRLSEAEVIYRQVLAQQPDHPDALSHLGVLAGQVGRYDAATQLINKAIAVSGPNPDLHYNVGEIYRRWGRWDEAIQALNAAIQLKADYAEAYHPLGLALAMKNQTAEAIAAFRQSLRFKPHQFESYNELGNALRKERKQDEAINAFKEALKLAPQDAEVLNNLGAVLMDKHQIEEATAIFREAIRLRPDFAEIHNNLGLALQEQNKIDEAMGSFTTAAALKPTHDEAHFNLGNILQEQGRFDEAMAAYRRVIQLKPNFPEVHNNLGCMYLNKKQIDEALECFVKAVEIKPNYASALANMGNALKEQGLPEEALASYDRAITVKPENPILHSNRLLAMYYHPGCSTAAIREQQVEWDRRHGQPLRVHQQPHANERNPDRRLRIGYVSSDFRDHVVGRNILPLLREHDHQKFEIHCYANSRINDAWTDQFRRYADGWRSVFGIGDEQLAELIRNDRIDILVDLALHTMGNRLTVFARKPAPVQVSFAGYPGGTGLTAIDYRLTDPFLDPPGVTDGDYVETSFRLPNSFWCYDPVAMMTEIADPPAVAPLPALQAGYITFGCLNNFCKVNDGVLRLWAQVLRAVPGSRILLLSSGERSRQRAKEILGHEGIAPERVTLIGRLSREDYLRVYHRIDLGLDTLPYNGHTTSLDSFWMGVPVVTLVGKTVVGRAGFSQLSNLGLAELAASTPEEYVRIVSELAGDVGRLGDLRAGLRERMRRSALTDAKGFAKGIEAAFGEMWRKWLRDME